jgi:hypothetical protein
VILDTELGGAAPPGHAGVGQVLLADERAGRAHRAPPFASTAT